MKDTRTELEARLDKARLTSGDADPFVHYERAACAELIRHGCPSQHESIKWAGKPGHYNVWCADSILFCIDSLRAGRLAEALRGWGQVREYRGRGAHFGPTLSDAAIGIQNALESYLRRNESASRLATAKAHAGV